MCETLTKEHPDASDMCLLMTQFVKTNCKCLRNALFAVDAIDAVRNGIDNAVVRDDCG